MSASCQEQTYFDLYQHHSRRNIVRPMKRLKQRAQIIIDRDDVMPSLNRKAQYENETPRFQPHRIGHGSQSIVGKFGACPSNGTNKKRASNAAGNYVAGKRRSSIYWTWSYPWEYPGAQHSRPYPLI
jgi:hypothetical protein